MFDFIRKNTLWDGLDKGYLEELDSNKISYQLKNAQDVLVYSHLREKRGLKIAEIGGGNSRILQRLAMENNCWNIEKFEGKHLGPKGEILLKNVQNINAYVGEFDSLIPDDFFDVIFSISVVEHIETKDLDNFLAHIGKSVKPSVWRSGKMV